VTYFLDGVEIVGATINRLKVRHVFFLNDHRVGDAPAGIVAAAEEKDVLMAPVADREQKTIYIHSSVETYSVVFISSIGIDGQRVTEGNLISLQLINHVDTIIERAVNTAARDSQHAPKEYN
jgi:hypothetical protein